MNMTEKDIMKACCGTDEVGNTNSAVKVQNLILNITTGEQKIINEVTLDNPSVNMFRSFRYTMVDLIFNSHTDYDFLNTTSMLNAFTVSDNSMDSEDYNVPSIVVTICPKEYDCEYYTVGMHGAWCLQPHIAGEEINTIRFIFDNELFHTYEVNDTSIDYKELSNEIYLEKEYDMDISN